MSLSYFNVKKLRRQSKQHDSHETTTTAPAPTVHSPSEEPASSPVLDEEDEVFLKRLAAIAAEPEGPPPPLPDRPVVILDGGEKKVGKDAQQAIMDGADAIPLPTSPPLTTVEDGGKGKEKATEEGGLGRKKSVMSYFTLAQSKLKRNGDKEGSKDKGKGKATEKDKAKAATDLHSAAEIAKTSEEAEVKKEQEDLSQILDQLNLSAVNNRVFSFSKESEELLNKFKLVLKDVVNGAPTAYDDMTKLFTESETQLKKMYGGLPPFMQNLIKSLPTKLTAALGPEILAAQAEKPGFDAKQKSSAFASASKGKGKPRVPSLKSLISAEGAVATMLKSILNFLKLRFPVLMTGTNILLSLAVFVLMFVFWYCHKRGRETRLEKEEKDRPNPEGADATVATDVSSDTDNDGDSVFGDNKVKGESSRAKGEKAEPPLVIQDDKSGEQNATVDDMPSVLHLPDPNRVPLPDTPAKEKELEEPLKVPKSK